MPFHSLTWRIGLPFVLLVLAETVTLVWWSTAWLQDEERTRIAALASTNAAFLAQASLPPSERLAADLARVTGLDVHFRHGQRLVPSPPAELAEALRTVPADGRAHAAGAAEVLGAPLHDGGHLLLVRTPGHERSGERVLPLLAALWLLALLIAWLALQGLVRPLRNLAARLPDIERPGSFELPEARRRDEIGDLARTFLRTRQELQDERDRRARDEKLAVLGRMTAAMAHEIQNPVAAIQMHSQLWRAGASPDSAGVVEQEARRIEEMLNQWLYLGRPEPPVLQPTDLAAVVASVLASTRAQCAHAGVHPVVRGPASLTVPGDGRRLTQVLRNLVTNAIQAMPSGGELAITLRTQGGAAEIEVADAGAGFSPSALARFGEFFYSEREGGMGIGLSVAHGIVKAHGGSLAAANRDGGGAAVTIRLPLSTPATTA